MLTYKRKVERKVAGGLSFLVVLLVSNLKKQDISHLPTSNKLRAHGNIGLDPVANGSWDVRFTLDGVNAAEFVDTIFINGFGDDFLGTATQDKRNDFYVVMGDSITVPTGDDISSDDTSLNGRSTGGGYPPILNDRLTSQRGYPHTIVNQGSGDSTSSYGAQFAHVLVRSYPRAQTYLVLYGTNDARPWLAVPSGQGLYPGDSGYAGSFKANMQQIITTIRNAGKSVVLAKIPIALADCVACTPYPNPHTGQRSQLIQSYNVVIDELRTANNIATPAPDFYTYFSQYYTTEYFDPIHPNGIGYQSMARIWCQTLTGTQCGGQ